MAELFKVEISGADPLLRGQQYGESAREPISRSIEFYTEMFRRATGLEWTEILARTSVWTELLQAYCPDLLDEVQGIADGSGRRFEEILALNGRGELSHGIPAEERKQEEGCSSFAIMPGANSLGRVWAGQNWDWRDELIDTVVMLRIEQPGKPTVICQVEAGQIGRHGVNSAGIALNANGLGGRFGKGLGVPSTYQRRRILESWDMHDALRVAFSADQTFCSNLLLTHREGFAIDLETTPGRHGWMYPDDGLLVHGNHFQSFVPPQIENTYKPFSVDSLYRVPRIEDGLKLCRTEGISAAETREIVRTTMSDHFGFPNSVCEHADTRRDPLDRSSTIVSSLADLTTGEYYATAGLPCGNDYELLPWDIYDGPGAEDRPDLAVPMYVYA
jgi:isopenicillin-N N-acyltransferase-like protein